MNLEPNIIFQGECEAAFSCYKRVFGGRIITMLSYQDSPMADQVPADWGGKIAHATMMIGERTLSGADAFPGSSDRPRGFHLIVHPASVTEAERVFGLLAEEGEVAVPLQKTFFSPGYGIVVDRFGISWKINSTEE